MRTPFGSWDVRRLAPRLPIDTLCSEVVGGRNRLGFAVELSPDGVRLERPYRPGPRPRQVELELQLPDEDDVVVATGAVRFDEIRRATAGTALAAASGLIRVTGLVLARIASRDRRLLLDYVMDRRAATLANPGLALGVAACYARG
jgi:hypothetical protein